MTATKETRPVKIPIYRSDTHDYYPDELTGEKYDFQPIPYSCWKRDNLLLASTYESGDEPAFAILAPSGAKVAEAAGGHLCLYLPGESAGMSALDAVELARAGLHGLRMAK